MPDKNKYVLNVIIYTLNKIFRPKSFVIEIQVSIINQDTNNFNDIVGTYKHIHTHTHTHTHKHTNTYTHTHTNIHRNQT